MRALLRQRLWLRYQVRTGGKARKGSGGNSQNDEYKENLNYMSGSFLLYKISKKYKDKSGLEPNPGIYLYTADGTYGRSGS